MDYLSLEGDCGGAICSAELYIAGFLYPAVARTLVF